MSFRGFGGVTRWGRSDCAFWADLSAESGTRTPVNCSVRLRTYVLSAIDNLKKQMELTANSTSGS